MFYVAEALLASEGKSFSKHSAVISAFGKEFAKSRRIDPKLHGHLRDAFPLRGDADYAVSMAFTGERAEEVIGWARDFLREGERFLHDAGVLDEETT